MGAERARERRSHEATPITLPKPASTPTLLTEASSQGDHTTSLSTAPVSFMHDGICRETPSPASRVHEITQTRPAARDVLSAPSPARERLAAPLSPAAATPVPLQPLREQLSVPCPTFERPSTPRVAGAL